MKKEKLLLVVLLGGVCVVVSGCVAAAIGAGAGTVAYIRGDLELTESAELDAVYKAAVNATEELELNLTSKTKDALSATIVSRDAQDKKVTIKLKAITEDSTKISIRIGLFGDEIKSKLIYDKIKDNL